MIDIHDEPIVDDDDVLEHDDDRDLYGAPLRDRCMIPDSCIASDPYHGPDECCTAEMIEAWERELGGEN